MPHYTFLICEEFTQELKVLSYASHLTKTCLMPFLLHVRSILSISNSGVIQRFSQARNCKTGLQCDDSVSLTVHKQVEARAEQLSVHEIFHLKSFVHSPWRTSLSLLLFLQNPPL